jgi:hypothetical protein
MSGRIRTKDLTGEFQRMDNDKKLAVLENENEKDNDSDFNDGGAVERSSSRPLLAVGAIAGLMLAILIIALALTRSTSNREVENMVRAGSPEFNAYKDKVVLEIDRDSRMVHPNMIGMWQLVASAKLTNRGDRELTGVEVIGKMIDLEDKVIAHKITRPLPSDRNGPLKPGESMIVKVTVDAPAKITEFEVKDILMELGGLRFR